jgi:ABC-2 type transport system permease protein
MVRDAFDANRTFRITRTFASMEELEEALLRREIDLTVGVWPDFSERIRKKETAELQVLVDGSVSNLASVRIAYTLNVLERLNRQFLAEMYPIRLDYGKIDERLRTWYNPNLESRYFFVPGIVAFLIMLTTLLFTSMAIIRERESGTMEQLVVTPIKPYELILAKTIPFIIIAFVQMVMVTAFAVYWFQIPLEGSVALLFCSGCLFLLSTIGIGLFISTVSATQQQATMTTFFFMLPFFLLSGFVFPITNMPKPVQVLTHVIPLRYFLVIIRGIFLKGVGLKVLWPQVAALLALGLVVFTAAVRRFHKRLD